MSSKSETGHSVNVDHFSKVVAAVKTMTDYNPANSEITVANLEIHLLAEKNVLDEVRLQAAPWIQAVNACDVVNTRLDPLLTRVYNAVAASSVSAKLIADVKSMIREIKGIRASAKLETVPGDPKTPTDQSVKQISASQKGIAHRIDNYNGLLHLLKKEPGYVPNEADLQIAALEALLAELKEKHEDVISANPKFEKARIQRNKLLYSETGGADLSSKVKKYVRSVYGGNSPQYHQVSGLKFTKPSK